MSGPRDPGTARHWHLLISFSCGNFFDHGVLCHAHSSPKHDKQENVTSTLFARTPTDPVAASPSAAASLTTPTPHPSIVTIRPHAWVPPVDSLPHPLSQHPHHRLKETFPSRFSISPLLALHPLHHAIRHKKSVTQAGSTCGPHPSPTGLVLPPQTPLFPS